MRLDGRMDAEKCGDAVRLCIDCDGFQPWAFLSFSLVHSHFGQIRETLLSICSGPRIGETLRLSSVGVDRHHHSMPTMAT